MASTYLTSGNLSSAGNQKKWTFSAWLKKATTGVDNAFFGYYVGSTNYFIGQWRSDDLLRFGNVDGGSWSVELAPNAVYRDLNAWYHVVFQYDSAQATSSNRASLWVNGEKQSSFATEVYPSQNANTKIPNAGYPITIGRGTKGSNTYYLNGCMSHVHFCDGYAYQASDFGETDATTGEWKIKTEPSVSYGTNGFFLLKDDNAVTDRSGQGNNFTLGGGTLTKTEDCPSNVFCTANPLSSGNSEAFNGNTNIFFDDTGQWRAMYSTLGASSGKYYMEAKVDAVGGEASIGVIPAERAALNQDTGDYLGKETDSVGYLNNGRIFKSNSQLETGLASMSSGTIVGISLNLDANTVQFYNNDSAVGSAVSLNADTTYLFGFSGYSDTRFYANFGNGYFHTTAVSSAGTNASGNGIFEYDVKPSDATALSTKGLNL